jgi:GTP cyclohydrolase I
MINSNAFPVHPVDLDTSPDAPTIAIQDLVRELLVKVGEDPDREGLMKTPLRVDRSMAFLTSGYRTDVQEVVNGAIFHEECDDIVVVRDVEFYSMCEHHMLPFFGTAHVAYVPDGKVIGLSKIPRIVEIFSRRLQLQERMTRQVAECIQEVLQPKGVAVITDARHLCMMMRGVEKQQSTTTSSTMLGVFRESTNTRQELLQILRMDR